MKPVRIFVSACLLGIPCRYDGKAKPLFTCQQLEKAGITPILFCPESAGGLKTPRPPAERQLDRIVTQSGQDVTAQYEAGAEKALLTAVKEKCIAALLKEKSPSCGKGRIYDGSFTGRLTDGIGITAEKLENAGIPVFGESRFPELLEWIKSKKNL